MKKIISKIKSKFKEKLFIADMLLIASFLIIFFTTFIINKFVAIYLLAMLLFILSYFIQKVR